jgi:hypothetical protein
MWTAEQKKTLDAEFRKQTDGNLYVNYGVIIHGLGGKRVAMLIESFYVVRDGVCYSIHPETMEEHPSGDPLVDVVSQCDSLGSYEANKHKVVRTDYKDVSVDRLKKVFMPKTPRKSK